MFRRLLRLLSKPPISKDFLQDTKLLPWVTLESHPILKTTLGKNVSDSGIVVLMKIPTQDVYLSVPWTSWLFINTAELNLVLSEIKINSILQAQPKLIFCNRHHQTWISYIQIRSASSFWGRDSRRVVRVFLS